MGNSIVPYISEIWEKGMQISYPLESVLIVMYWSSLISDSFLGLIRLIENIVFHLRTLKFQESSSSFSQKSTVSDL